MNPQVRDETPAFGQSNAVEHLYLVLCGSVCYVAQGRSNSLLIKPRRVTILMIRARTEYYFHEVLFVISTLYVVVLTFTSVNQNPNCATIHMKGIEQYFHVDKAGGLVTSKCDKTLSIIIIVV